MLRFNWLEPVQVLKRKQPQPKSYLNTESSAHQAPKQGRPSTSTSTSPLRHHRAKYDYPIPENTEMKERELRILKHKQMKWDLDLSIALSISTCSTGPAIKSRCRSSDREQKEWVLSQESCATVTSGKTCQRERVKRLKLNLKGRKHNVRKKNKGWAF